MTLGFKNLFGGNQNSQDQWNNNSNNDYFNYSPAVVQTKWVEDSHAYYLKVALPGLTEKDISVKVDDATGDPSNPLVTIKAGVDVTSYENNNQSGFFSNSNKNQFQNQTPFSQGHQGINEQNFQQTAGTSYYSHYSSSGLQGFTPEYQQFNYTSVFNQFYLSFPVPTSRVKVDDVQASTDLGVLTVKFPKQQTSLTQGARPIQLSKSRL